MPDLHNDRSGFGSYQTSFETMESKIAEMSSCSSKEKSVVEEKQETFPPDVDKKTDRFHDLRLLEDQRRSEERDLHDHLKK